MSKEFADGRTFFPDGDDDNQISNCVEICVQQRRMNAVLAHRQLKD